MPEQGAEQQYDGFDTVHLVALLDDGECLDQDQNRHPPSQTQEHPAQLGHSPPASVWVCLWYAQQTQHVTSPMPHDQAEADAWHSRYLHHLPFHFSFGITT